MVEDTGDFSKQGADELCSYWNIDVEQFLNSQRKTLFVGHPGGGRARLEYQHSVKGLKERIAGSSYIET